MREKAKGIVCLVMGIGALVFCIATLAQLVGRAEMLVPWQEFEASEVIEVYWTGIKIMGAMLGLGFLSGLSITLGIQELRSKK